jgi:hypothetical protein
MTIRAVSGRLLEMLILAGIAAAVTYGITAWLEPPGVSPRFAAAAVGGVAALVTVLPAGLLNVWRQREESSPSLDTYYDYNSSADKDESWGN